MASNSEYEQRRMFEEPISEMERCSILLNELKVKYNIKELFKEDVLNSTITGELRIEINN